MPLAVMNAATPPKTAGIAAGANKASKRPIPQNRVELASWAAALRKASRWE